MIRVKKIKRKIKKFVRLIKDVMTDDYEWPEYDLLYGEFELPSEDRYRMYKAGLDPHKDYPDDVLIEHGLDPESVNHLKYGFLHKKRR